MVKIIVNVSSVIGATRVHSQLLHSQLPIVFVTTRCVVFVFTIQNNNTGVNFGETAEGRDFIENEGDRTQYEGKLGQEN